MKTINHLLDVGRVVPDVDVSRAETLEAVLHEELERLDVVSAIVNLLREGLIAKARVVGILQNYRSLGMEDNMQVLH